MKLLKKFSKKKFNSALLKIWLKKALYYISYPFRLWGVWLFILIVAYLGPTFRGVKPAEVHLWYWEKVTSCFSSISELFSEQTDSLRKKIDISNPFVKNKADILVSMPTRQTEPERKAFAKAETSPQGIDVMQQEQAQILPEGVVPVLETNSIENVQSIGTKPSLSMENNRLSFDNN